MVYNIFLKSLRSLEEFWKNPHIKIPPKYPCTNFHSLEKFKNSIFIPKRFPLQIWSSRPSWPYWPNPTQPLTRPQPPTETSATIVPVSRRRASTA
jgi:hypothetical protein